MTVKVLAAVLLRYARGKADCWPSVTTLAIDLGRCRRTVQLGLRALEAAGWITTAPADNPTGRVILLAWRLPPAGGEAHCAPRAQEATPAPAQRIAPESERNGEKEKPAAMAQGGPPPAPGKGETPAIRTETEARTFYAEVGWLGRPVNDPLRRLAEARVREIAAGKPAQAASGPPWSSATSGGSLTRGFATIAPRAVGGPQEMTRTGQAV